MILRWIFKKKKAVWTGLIWLRAGIGGGLLWMRRWTFVFHKMRGISWVAEDVFTSQEGLCSMQLVSHGPFDYLNHSGYRHVPPASSLKNLRILLFLHFVVIRVVHVLYLSLIICSRVLHPFYFWPLGCWLQHVNKQELNSTK
jgi:hypothetical protein